MAKDLSNLKLNPEQIEAIKHGTGPLLIIAGAGTGKTTVVTERIKYLVLSKKAKPQEILALTFTEKAAREMEERVDVGLPYGYTQMWVMTFHSFCDRILRREALNIGLDPRYKLMSEAESIQLLRSNLFKFNLNYFRPLGNPNKFIGGMLQHFSRLQDEDISPLEYSEWAKKLKAKTDEEKLDVAKWMELAAVYKSYDELKVREGLLDFGDLIVKTLKLFRERGNVLREYAEQFKYILIDEFQDTNYAQNQLAILLAQKTKNINVVGDDDQSIYRFRGAAVSNIVQFRKNFPDAKVTVLSKNYRSTQEILDRSYDLIQFNNPDRLEIVEKIEKRLTSVRLGDTGKKNGDPVEFIHANRVENEGEEIAKTIKTLAEEKKYKWQDFAILVRANNHSEPIMRSLARAGVPYQFLGPGRLFKQAEVIDLISYLKTLYNFEDSVAFYRLLSIPYFDISGRDIAALGNFSKKKNVSLFEAAEKISEIEVEENTKEKINKIVSLIKKHLGIVRKETAGQLLYYFLEETGLLQNLLSPKNIEAEKVANNVSKFFDKIKSYEADHEDATIPAVVDWLGLSIEVGESPLAADKDWGEVNAVNILTVHSAKGLEFPVVFLVNLSSQRFPTIERREQIPIPEVLIKEVLPVGDYHLQEERRLFYVGMTRAKDRLFLTAADYYGEGNREKRLSPFIFEALGKNFKDIKTKTEKHEQLSFLDYQSKRIENPVVKNANPKIDYLSYSQIETFSICPLHYKLHYIYKIPTPPSASQSFGITMHATLKEFYEQIKNKQKPTDKLLYKLLEENWIDEGYTSKKHEKEFLERGKIYLSGFLKEGFDKNTLPISMEEGFIVPLENGSERLKIGGKIDRIDVDPQGCIEIIDYKTGATIPSQKEVDRNLQLSFYALAATKIPFAPYGKKCEEVKLSLYFLDTQEKITTTRKIEDLKRATDEIFKAKEAIEKSEFRCSGHMFCQNCEYSLFCKADQA